VTGVEPGTGTSSGDEHVTGGSRAGTDEEANIRARRTAREGAGRTEPPPAGKSRCARHHTPGTLKQWRRYGLVAMQGNK
jgi:hypothetical protein